MIPSGAMLALACVTGAALGSFAVTAGLRRSRGEGVLIGRSRCDGCGRTLGFVQTLPLMSYAWLGGACASCKGPIDPAHLAGEAAGGLVVVTSLLAADPTRSVLLSALGLTLIAAATVDQKVGRLPNVFTGVVAALGLTLSMLRGREIVLEGLIAAVVVGGALLLLRAASRWLRGDPGLGLGDVKLLGALGLWIGTGTSLLVAGAALVALFMVLATRPIGGRLAFGPAIVVSAWAVGIGQEAGLWLTTM